MLCVTHFEEGLDISRPEVLSDIAVSLDVDPYDGTDEQAVRRDWQDGVQRGVLGSPHFYCGDLDAFCPSLDISRREGGQVVLRKDTAALDSLLARCFGN